MKAKTNKAQDEPNAKVLELVPEESQEKRSRKKKPFPLAPFEECYEFAKVIHTIGAGQKVRRLTIFEKLEKSPDSGPSRMMITNCNKYGLIIGGYTAEYIELTTKGKQATDGDTSTATKLRVKFELAIQVIEVFNRLYEQFAEGKMPSHAVIADLLGENEKDLSKNEISQVVDIFTVNLKYLGLLMVIGGAERVIKIDHAIENLNASSPKSFSEVVLVENNTLSTVDMVRVHSRSIETYDIFDNICFYISPIGEEDTEFRKHSDLFLGSIVEPALETLGLKVKRADQIDKPGTISKQVIEYLYKSKLVIADLSFHNPNVFYELAVRHMFRLPTVQIIRKADKIPFDVNQTRTIVLDTTDIYSLVPRIETYKSQIASQARQALTDPDAVDNPVTVVFPKLIFSFG